MIKQLTKVNAILFATFILFSVNVFSSEYQPITDAVIIAKIESKIALDQSLSIFKLNVSATNGHVALSGNVDSDSDASAAIEIAQSTDGVIDVNASGLVIKQSKHPFSDMVITAKVKGEFIKEKLFNDTDFSPTGISVETINGTVSLNGTVDNQQQADNAIRIAKSVSGVKSVESRIKVK